MMVAIHERFNIREKNNKNAVICFGYLGNDHPILYAKYFIYVENKTIIFNIDFLGYLSYLKNVLRIENGICWKRNQIHKFEKFNIIYDNL